MELKEMNSEMEVLLGQYLEIYNLIFEKFGLDSAYGELNLNCDVRWFNEHGSIHWFDGGDTEYSYDSANEHGSYGDYVLFYVYDNGEQFYCVFDKNKLLSDDEYEEIAN